MLSKTEFIMLKILTLTFLSIISCGILIGEKPYELTVEKIMQDPKWLGTSPSNIHWSEDSKWIYFKWNPKGTTSDSLYKVSPKGGEPIKVSQKDRIVLPSKDGDYTKDFMKKVYEKNGDIFLLNIKSDKRTQITKTITLESSPLFSSDEKSITYISNGNLFKWEINTGSTIQMTDFKKYQKIQDDPISDQQQWLKDEELDLIKTINNQRLEMEEKELILKAEKPKRPLSIIHGEKIIQSILLSPNEKIITFHTFDPSPNIERTIVPNYVTATGFTKNLDAREKVGRQDGKYEFGIYNIIADTVTYLSTDSLPNIFDTSNFNLSKTNINKIKREVHFTGPIWSEDGNHAVLILQSLDNKDRWIILIDPSTSHIKLLDHQHDEAWIGGPGIRWWRGPVSMGWTPDNKSFWFQSEETGYSHLFSVDVITGLKKQLTSGEFEVRDVRISRDKKWWYFRSNQVHPGELHLYRMKIQGGKWEKVTSMVGNNETWLSPDEKFIAIRHSYSNRPWDLFLMKNKIGSQIIRLTKSQTDDWNSYPWRVPDIITFKAEDGAKVYGRIYLPDKQKNSGAAVIFVHGAGYLQNVHKWWSNYFREYMFHNLLADNGYTVLDIDYRGSAGYGRDWRTSIYRHMGSKDLNDQVDGAKMLVNEYDVNPEKIGIYGGSYGGFITLMAMFTKPGVFSAGASLRPVTDWAHYNHPYTSNILNIPQVDSIAYRRSSPIYHAEGLRDALLICHGMIDTNVHFQDVVRLAQRLIELGKKNWEVAIYPIEGHGFKEPSSWTDEYRRIFKLFETELK
tara:strand:+ start:9644 stop:12019 length:2376 start_codon:yes stop_codon:yes gene_type:complete